MQRPLVMGNWKMHPATRADADALVKGVVAGTKKMPALDVAVAPPFVFIERVSGKFAKSAVTLAAQTMFAGKLGAHTGEVSPLMLRDLGVTHVILGHSERRALGETDAQVAEKVALALAQKLTPVVCVGERERDPGAHYLDFVAAQVAALVAVVPKHKLRDLVIAYEPIWAIGTGETATPADAEEMRLFIQKQLTAHYDRVSAKRVRILYGGSVKAGNAEALIREGGVDGFLVGGASLDANEFVTICQIVNSHASL